MEFWLFGAGKYGMTYVQNNDKSQICGFIDNDSKKVGTYICDIPVIAYKDFLQKFDSKTQRIIITNHFYDECYAQLKDNLLHRYVVGGG